MARRILSQNPNELLCFFCFTVRKYLKFEIEISSFKYFLAKKKPNSIIHFLGESMARQSAFGFIQAGFIWPLVAIHKRGQQHRGGRCHELAKIANSSRVIWSDLSISSELLDLFHLLLFSEFTWRSWLSYFSELASYCLSNVSGFLFTQNIGIRLLYNFGTHPKRPP